VGHNRRVQDVVCETKQRGGKYSAGTSVSKEKPFSPSSDGSNGPAAGTDREWRSTVTAVLLDVAPSAMKRRVKRRVPISLDAM